MNRPAARRTIALMALSCLPAMSSADILNITWDNDLFLGSDQGYTNGGRLSYLSSPAEASGKKASRLARSLRDHLTPLPGIGAGANQHAVSFSLRQLIVTPEDISDPEPQYDDLPYVGYLSLSSALWSWNSEQITGVGAHVGVVGPESGAEATQKWVHKITGSDRPRGWDEQLGTDVVGGIQASHGRKLMQTGGRGGIEQQLSATGSAMLSSFKTSARTGVIWRLGQNLPMNFVPDYAGTSTSIALPGSLNDGGTSWSVFIGAGVEYIAYSYIEDKAGPYRVDDEPFTGQLGLGGTWQWKNVQAALILRATTGEGDRNKENFSFGTLSLSWAL